MYLMMGIWDLLRNERKNMDCVPLNIFNKEWRERINMSALSGLINSTFKLLELYQLKLGEFF